MSIALILCTSCVLIHIYALHMQSIHCILQIAASSIEGRPKWQVSMRVQGENVFQDMSRGYGLCY